MTDQNVIWIIAGVVLLLLAIGVVWYFAQSPKRERAKLKEEFGPEYDRIAGSSRSEELAAAELKARRERVTKYAIRELTSEEQERFAGAWRRIQALFVDDPAAATRQADQLVSEVMTERGYPVKDFEQQAADLSVNYPELVSNYRAAHEMYLRNERGEATTEELREAFVHYRSLFVELLERKPITTGTPGGRTK
jgi:hypothetical protein